MENKFDRLEHVGHHFTVIGFWPDTMQRFADSYMAMDSGEAEKMCLRLNDGVSVCGVIKGKHACVDTHTYVHPE
jgi:hypothetical protein